MFGLPLEWISAAASSGVFGIALITLIKMWPAIRKLSLDESQLALSIHQAANQVHREDMDNCRKECGELRAIVRDLERMLDTERRERREAEDGFREQILKLKADLAGFHQEKIQSARSALTVIPKAIPERKE
jgi:hypothetical protein